MKEIFFFIHNFVNTTVSQHILLKNPAKGQGIFSIMYKVDRTWIPTASNATTEWVADMFLMQIYTSYPKVGVH